MHACSVGEVASTKPLVARLLEEGHPVHMTVITDTGFAHAGRLFGETITRSYLPLDLPFVFRRFVRALAPGLALVFETEFWPGMLAACARAGVPVVSVNTRISDRSFPRYRATRWFWRRALVPVQRFLAQSEEDAKRLVAIGADPARVVVAGNLKYAVPAPQVDAKALRARIDPWGARTVLVAASTHAGEEATIARMFHELAALAPELLLVVVPRHPERFDEAEEALLEAGLRVRRWHEAPSAEDQAVLVVAGLYFVADLAFVGGSLAPIGGHNPLEPARAGVPVVAGPHVQNFRAIYAELVRAGGAVVAHDEAELRAVLSRWLERPDERAQAGERARAFAEAQAHVLDRVWAEVSRFLQK